MSSNGLLDGIDDVPWHRIVHFYGRASDIPPAIHALGSSTRLDAIRHLCRCLEHQDGVIQATPFAVRFILRMRKSDPDGVAQIIAPIVAASECMLKNYRGPTPSIEWETFLSENNLWPVYTDERKDQILWEEWSPPPEEWAAWPILTLREIEQNDASRE